jgi:hypothetical protein
MTQLHLLYAGVFIALCVGIQIGRVCALVTRRPEDGVIHYFAEEKEPTEEEALEFVKIMKEAGPVTPRRVMGAIEAPKWVTGFWGMTSRDLVAKLERELYHDSLPAEDLWTSEWPTLSYGNGIGSDGGNQTTGEALAVSAR